jgi:RHH-type proline utilization regulon transcriptional repressor/proline dehydrogenase/delta 1-pyrroline-5-carboxylate dehydrogenase
VFGPVLHVIPFDAGQLDSVIEAINATGYGLTCGIHSRIDETVQKIAKGVRAGNCYVQPQPDRRGGRRAAPSGRRRPLRHRPKGRRPALPSPASSTNAPLTINTTAAGGNASLLTLAE